MHCSFHCLVAEGALAVTPLLSNVHHAGTSAETGRVLCKPALLASGFLFESLFGCFPIDVLPLLLRGNDVFLVYLPEFLELLLSNNFMNFLFVEAGQFVSLDGWRS